MKSASGKGAVLLKMTLTDDDWKNGTVLYKGSKEPIPIVFVSSRELERHDGRPSYMQYTWHERYKGKITGTYILCIQGTNIYESRYIRKRDNKRFDLERANTDDDCTECLKSDQ